MNRLDSLDVGIIRAVFRKYDSDEKEYLNVDDFTAILNGTGERDSNLIEAMFAYANTATYRHMTFQELCVWWMSGEYRSKWRHPRSRTLLKEAYALFKEYSTAESDHITSGDNGLTYSLSFREDSMTYRQFHLLIQANGYLADNGETFDTLVGDDNEMSFKTFYRWLNW